MNVPIVIRRSRRRSLVRCVFMLQLGLAVIIPCNVIRAQTARVQFIHLSPYAEAAVIDVYRNGELWLDDFTHTEATPFTDWPEGRTRLDFTWADAQEASSPFFSGVWTFDSGDSYYVVAAGDPLNNPGQPPFDLFIRDNAREVSETVDMPEFIDFSAMPDLSYHVYTRDFTDTVTGTAQMYDYPTVRYGTWSPYYMPLPPWQIEADSRSTEDLSILWTGILDVSRLAGQTIIHVGTGFYNPPRPGDSGTQLLLVLPDGTTRRDKWNHARVQFTHNAPYLEADTLDIYISRLDSLGGDQIVHHIDNLSFREATRFLELPSGRITGGQTPTAPELVIDVTTSDAADTLFSSEPFRLLYSQTYVAVLAGDPLGREDQPQMDLSIFEGWRERAADSGRVDLLFSHGVPDMIAANIGIEGEPLPLAGYLSFGEFASSTLQAADDDTLYIAHADTRVIAAFAELELLTRGLADSALVVLTSGFLNPPEGIASEDSDLALVAALPSGGPLLRFVMKDPPPWWQKPWIYLVGLAVLGVVALVGYQVRIMRLRARERELTGLVEERTRELVAEKEKTEEQARRLVELDEAKSRFFANISHEFRTPLTLILGPIQDAIQGSFGAFDKRYQKQLSLMQRSGLRLHNLIDQLLDLSRLEVGRLQLRAQERDLVPFARALTLSFTSLAERRKITLQFEEKDPELLLYFDAEKMQKVITNLLSNAFKFTPDGGKIHVAVGLAAGEDGVLAEVSVSDMGEGIPIDDLPHIFDRFYQADTSSTRRFEGTGIGLALARELVELHGGLISVESSVGSGSTFIVSLPLGTAHLSPESMVALADEDALSQADEAVFTLPAPEEEAPNEEFEEETVQAPDDAPLILVVEDNVDVRTYLKDHLVEHYRIAEAEDGVEALEKARKQVPDLVISDVMMPRMDGFELCRAIKEDEELGHVPVVLLTARATDEDMVEGLQTGADDYIFKPFNAEVLLARVENLIELRLLLRKRFEGRIVIGPSDISVSSAEATFLERVREVVEEHMADGNFGVDWMAEEVGLSPRQLQRRLRSLIKLSPAGYIRVMRLERAAQLLEQKAGNVSEIAYSVGFNNPYHFSRLFRQTLGVAPSDFPARNPADG